MTLTCRQLPIIRFTMNLSNVDLFMLGLARGSIDGAAIARPPREFKLRQDANFKMVAKIQFFLQLTGQKLTVATCCPL